jgi:hypothetical protein
MDRAGGRAAFDLPFAELIFPLDVGTHRRIENDPPLPATDLAAEPPSALHKVLIEVEPKDIAGLEFSGYHPGVYDSPYSPAAVRAAPQRAGRARRGAVVVASLVRARCRLRRVRRAATVRACG